MIRVFSVDKEWYVLSSTIVNPEIFLIIATANLEYLSCIATDMPSLGGEAMSKFGRPAKYGARK